VNLASAKKKFKFLTSTCKMAFFGKMRDLLGSPALAKLFCEDSPDSPTFAKRRQNGDKIMYFQGLANLANLAISCIRQYSLFGKYERITRRADIRQTIWQVLARLANICQLPFLRKNGAKMVTK
jgi:hypothetical protein